MSSARLHRFAGFLFGAELLRNIVLYYKLLVTLRASTTAEENFVHHRPDRQFAAAMWALDALFDVWQFDLSSSSGHVHLATQL